MEEFKHYIKVIVLEKEDGVFEKVEYNLYLKPYPLFDDLSDYNKINKKS